ncbi:hypothetical protein EMPG_14863 [Blastomyces silverae]|uniref:Uncharacterized protein n=1 Tax=Blastomyces silverae TaxID=2060906 RepID=A0A0H1BKL1_9EURO|nr:hypothetical protein EMPG_14863 [Blastomyces silverae]
MAARNNSRGLPATDSGADTDRTEQHSHSQFSPLPSAPGSIGSGLMSMPQHDHRHSHVIDTKSLRHASVSSVDLAKVASTAPGLTCHTVVQIRANPDTESPSKVAAWETPLSSWTTPPPKI